MMPFPGGIESLSNGTLIFSAALALFYLYSVTRLPSLRRTVAKTASIALLALLAWIEGGPTILVAALALSAIGDACLAQEGESAFMGGLSAFLAAHIAYVVLFALIGGGWEAVAGPRMAIAALMAVSVVGSLIVLWNGVPGALKLPVIAYSAAILAMGLFALTVPNPLVAAGAVLFMASDSLLATGKFRADIASRMGWLPQAVWLLYYAAQVVLTLSVLAIS
ncbi:MAG: lysoplasmalogenase [Mesorhizobium sp.]